jgi:hypothetical protein
LGNDKYAAFILPHAAQEHEVFHTMGDRCLAEQVLVLGNHCGLRNRFPYVVQYIPTINHVVFKHEGISWEWGVVFIESILFFAGVEAWKFGKRVFFRARKTKSLGSGEASDLSLDVFSKYTEGGEI